MTPESFLANYRPDGQLRPVTTLAEFQEAIAAGENLWGGSPDTNVSWSTDNFKEEYTSLKAHGWSVLAHQHPSDTDRVYVYSPHPRPPVEGSMQGFILDPGPGSSCAACLLPTEEPYTLPWLYAGETYTCVRCHKHYRCPE